MDSNDVPLLVWAPQRNLSKNETDPEISSCVKVLYMDSTSNSEEEK